ncbi:MAG: universal stress protein, partial [Polyangia bacterium]|nr:universal stress protein [Polyangia bacterium]
MSRRIVVGLDPSEYSKMAVNLACDRAKEHGGTVVGVGVVDLPGIEKASHGAGVGASHFAKKAREKHITAAGEDVEALISSFQKTCQAAGVAFETELKSGSPTEEIADAGRSADLIIIGTRTFFHFETDQAPGETLQELLKEQVCPILVVPKELDLPLKKVIFPYDSSAKAARSMRDFVALA